MTVVETKTPSLFFEDFYVGQVLLSGTRVVTADDLATFTRVSGDHHPLHTDPDIAQKTRFERPILQGPYGLALVFGLLNDMHVIDDSIVGLLDTNWRYLRPIYPGDTLSFAMTIIGTRRTSKGDEGVIDRHITLRDAAGRVVQEGTSAILVQAHANAGRDEATRAFGTRQWAELLAESLGQNAAFVSATASFDGTIALRSGTDEIGFHLYRGRIVEVTTWTPLGPTFTLIGSRLNWTRLFTGPHNDFIEAAMRNDITVYGNTYEYRRLIKAIMILVDHGRELAAKGDQR